MAPTKRPIKPLNKPSISFSFPTGSSHPPPKPRQPKFNTLTTRGRIAKAHHTAKLEKATPDGIVTDADPGPSSKKRAIAPLSAHKAADSDAKHDKATEAGKTKATPKKRQRALFERPEDMEAEMEAAKVLKEKKARDKKKPKTTKSIIRDVKAKEARAAKVKERAEAKAAGGDANEGEREEREKQGKNLMGLMWDMKLMGTDGKGEAGPRSDSKGISGSNTMGLKGHGSDENLLGPLSNISGKDRRSLKVLFRPTARALRQRREMKNSFDLSEIWRMAEASAHDPKLKGLMMFQNIKGGDDVSEQTTIAKSAMTSIGSPGAPTGQTSGQGVQPETVVSANEQCFLLKIPVELRSKIIQLAVTDTRYFVDPLSPTGAEQPDLAMTCRQLRAEVLPIYYSANAFVFETIVEPVKQTSSGTQLSDRGKQRAKRLARLQRWLSMLQHGGHMNTVRRWVLDCTSSQPTPVFSLGNKAPKASEVDSSQTGPLTSSEDVSLLVSLTFPPTNARKVQTPQLEVHSSAACLLAGLADSGRCTLRYGSEAAKLREQVARKIGKGRGRGEVLLEVAGLLERVGSLRAESCIFES